RRRSVWPPRSSTASSTSTCGCTRPDPSRFRRNSGRGGKAVRTVAGRAQRRKEIGMTQMEERTATDFAASLDDRLEEHLTGVFVDDWEVKHLSQHFRREGYVKIPYLIPADVKTLVRDEVHRLLDLHAKRIDIRLKETGDSPRKMSTVSQAAIAQD